MNKKILALAIPNIISNITVPLLGMVNIAIMGRLGTDSLIGAISIGTTIFNFIYWNFGFLRMGTSGLVAQAYGARDFREVTALLVRSLSVALGVAFLLVVLQSLVGKLTFAMMSASDETMGYVSDYFYACIWAAPPTLILFTLQGWFIGMQNSRFPMYIAVFVNLLNVVASIWFVFGMKMGIAGVAWGTVVAQYGGLLLTTWLLFHYYGRLLERVRIRESIQLKPMLRFFSINRDIFLRTSCIVVVYTFFTAASSGMGDTLLAVNTLLMQLFTLFSYLMDGFGFAAESLIGRYVGAQNPVMVKRYIKYLLWWGLGISILYVGIYTIWWEGILRIFTSSEAIIEGARSYIGWVVAVPLAAFFAFIIDGALIGATQTRVMRNSVFLSTAAFFAAYYASVGLWGNNALWGAMILFLVSRGALLYFMTNRLRTI